MSPEESLWLEVILRALQDVVGLSRDILNHKTARADCAREALSWFFDEDSNIGGFLFCCEAIGVDPNAIRRGLTAANIQVIERELYSRLNSVRSRPVRPLDTFDVDSGRRISPVNAGALWEWR